MTAPVNGKAPDRPRLGFRYWMERVLEEAKQVEQGFAADPVHDLRVALRRCRSMADGFRTIDPDPAWRAMKRAGGRVFRSLGDLRDVQVMREWVKRLPPPEDPLQQVLDQALADREDALKRDAQTSLGRLDHDQWRKWADHLGTRAARVRIENPVFQYLALERWHEAYELHRRALRNRSKVSWHALRVGIKRFRYTAENFLPERHERWGKDLKDLQDALGDVHDLDVLWEQIRAYGFGDGEIVSSWRTRIVEERGCRVEEYRRKMVGPSALWHKWREELPQGTEQHQALLARAQTLVGFSSASVLHARHVMRLALQLYDGLLQSGVLGATGADLKSALQLAAILQDVGRFQAKRGHHKRSYRMLGRMAAPLDWSAENWEIVAALVRYHRGALPEASHAWYGKIPVRQQHRFLQLAAILRLANALDAGHARTVRSLKVLRTAETITLLASGYVEDPETTPGIAIAKHLLETACRLPVVIRPVDIRAVGVGKLTVLRKRTSSAAAQQKRSPVSLRRLALS
jgi:CHAD domain-containing protein